MSHMQKLECIDTDVAAFDHVGGPWLGTSLLGCLRPMRWAGLFWHIHAARQPAKQHKHL